MSFTRSLVIPFTAAALSLTACAVGDDAGGDEVARVELDAAAQITTTTTAPTTPSEAAPATTVLVETVPPAAAATPEVTTVPPAAEPVPPTTAVTAPEPSPVVASLQVDVTNYDGETIPLVIDLTTADRSNGRVEIKFTMLNTSDVAEWTIISQFGDGDAGTNNDMGGVSLIDLVNNQRYLVLIDSEGKCICSMTPDGVGPGQSISYQASLPAPPADVTVVDVQLGGVTLFTDVPLTDR